MIQACDRPEERTALGAWALGALDPADQVRVDFHLASCTACRAEAAGLAAVSAVLPALSPAEVAALIADDPPPAAPLATVTPLTTARRRVPWGTAGMAVAAAAVIAAAVLGATRLGLPPQPAPPASSQGPGSYGTPVGPWLTAATTARSPGAVVTYRQMGWGTLLYVKVTGIPPGTRCQLTVVASAGQRVTAGSWTTDAAVGRVWYPISVAVPANGVLAFVITVAGRPLVTVTA